MNPSPSALEAARQLEIDEWLDDHCGGADIFIQGQCHGYSIPAVRELLRAFSRRAAAPVETPAPAQMIKYLLSHLYKFAQTNSERDWMELATYKQLVARASGEPE